MSIAVSWYPIASFSSAVVDSATVWTYVPAASPIVYLDFGAVQGNATLTVTTTKFLIVMRIQGMPIENAILWQDGKFDGTNYYLYGDIYFEGYDEPLLRQNLTTLGVLVNAVALDGSNSQHLIYSSSPVSSWPTLTLNPASSPLVICGANGTVLSNLWDSYTYTIALGLIIPPFTSGPTNPYDSGASQNYEIKNFRLLSSFDTINE